MPLSLFHNPDLREEARALVDQSGAHTYGELLTASATAASTLLAGAADLGEARIAYLVPPGFEHVAVQWGIWRAGGIAVPLGISHPPPELAHVLDDAGASTLVVHPDLADRIRPLLTGRSLRLLATADVATAPPGPLPDLDPSRRALILYTSGTTGKPKGAVLTHANLQAQVESLVEAWEWSPADRILHVLPLHHVHGIVNALTCALWAGASCEFMPFEPIAVLQRLSRGDLSLFMAVPTIYAKLIAAWRRAAPTERAAWRAGCDRLRLMVSGSAALPASVFAQWQELTGHTLLERYGMTEIGMALSNPLHGERRPGCVGTPLPGIDVRLVDGAGEPVVEPGTPGEIEVRGAGVTGGYWNLPQETAAAFSGDWFRTGDAALIDDGYYRILGRQSTDIIKTGGYKVSALEVEGALLEHPGIRECAVVGIPDPVWGQRVAACLVTGPDSPLELSALRAWAAERIAPYKIPTRLRLVDRLPRNAMGKIFKPQVAALFGE